MSSPHPQSAAATNEDRAHDRWRAEASGQPFAIRDERPEIEGLRGLAILSLLAVHCAPGLSKGGAIGIDIFFVVSGYLVARTLWRQDGTASDWEAFFSRRLQRVVPALVAVLVGCLAFGTLFTLPHDLHALGRSMAWGASFLTNLDAWLRAVPIDVTRSLDPFWHLWQVAAIVQACILLALLTWTLQRLPRTLLAVIVTTGAISFVFNLVVVEDAPGAAFYLLAGRWWELVAGAGLAWWSSALRRPADRRVGKRPAPSSETAKAWGALAPHLGWIGTACFAMAILLAGETAHFPGWWAVLPVAGTICLLAAGPHDAVNRHVLAQPLLRFYGRVSYPLYLWHWPVLCFPLLLGVPLAVDVRVLILLVSVVLAALTHELIEKPIAMLQPTRRSSAVLLAALSAMCLIGVFVVTTDGLRFTFPADLQLIPGLASPRGH